MDAADVEHTALDRFQFGEQSLGKEKGCKQIDVEGLAPVLPGKIVRTAEYLDGGVIDESFEAMAIQTLTDAAEEFGGIDFVFDGAGQIGLDVVGAGQVWRLRCKVGGDDSIASVMEHLHERTSDAAGGAGNKGSGDAVRHRLPALDLTRAGGISGLLGFTTMLAKMWPIIILPFS